MKKIALIMGSDSDMPVVEKAVSVLKKLEIPHTVHIMSAHRTPDRTSAFAKNAESEGYGVLVAFAGKAAHLAGVIAANTVLPVIGVPIKGSDLGGLDALLATVQMPSGIPVATVAIDGGANAAWLAARMLSNEEPELREKLRAEAARMAAEVEAKDNKLNNN
jgi:5-(carboxyamino)imidazole ribonucleotide mutase